MPLLYGRGTARLVSLWQAPVDEHTYRAVQPIYYPGFTIGGAVGEFGGMLTLIGLLLLSPTATRTFPSTLAALVALAAMQGVYWVVIHPVNRFWVAGQDIGRAGKGFFKVDNGAKDGPTPPWTDLRDPWKWGHVVRAVLGLAGFIALATAIAF
jgi:hypothetical protein